MDTKELLSRAQNEIAGLRRENEILRAKVEMIDLFACVLHTQAAQHGGGAMHPDILYELQKKLAEMSEREAERPRS